MAIRVSNNHPSNEPAPVQTPVQIQESRYNPLDSTKALSELKVPPSLQFQSKAQSSKNLSQETKNTEIGTAAAEQTEVFFKRILKRYGAAEIGGSVAAISGGYAALAFGCSPALTALVGTVCENVGYYGAIIGQDYRSRINAANGQGFLKKYVYTLGTTCISVAAEFGAAEALDSGFTRPGLLYAGQAASKALGGGIVGQGAGFLIGKIAADIIFYSVVIPNKALLDKMAKRFLKRSRN